jgi:hypothetical protein
LYELKLDGYRAIAFKTRGQLHLQFTRTCLYLPYHGQSHFNGSRLPQSLLCFLYRFLMPLRPRLGMAAPHFGMRV